MASVVAFPQRAPVAQIRRELAQAQRMNKCAEEQAQRAAVWLERRLPRVSMREYYRVDRR